MPVLTEGAIKLEYLHNSNVLENDHSEPTSQAEAIAKNILADVMRFRRLSSPQEVCTTSPCQKCLAPHLSKMVSAIERSRAVTFVLPAFPGKSPNLAKVLGPLPDMAERRALEFLQYLCDRISRYYAPGARIILCSDGRVFSDVVGMRDDDVSAYQDALSQIILEMGLTSISTFNLEDISQEPNFDQMRKKLMERYGEPLDVLKTSVRRGGNTHDCSTDDQEAHRLYCGMIRFLLEDAMFPGQRQSRTALQKECRVRAYEVIQRSKAWSKLIEIQFPNAVRLSIHPQSCGDKKLGIRLMHSTPWSTLWPDNWQTPWHGVAVDLGGHFVLMKRSEAEAMGAHLVVRFGRPSHYVLTNGEALSGEAK